MATKYEMSKTYQYRKVMKPLLERKRRARINKCLDDLKDLMGACLQQEDELVKLEKADILELTVQHLRKLKAKKQQLNQSNINAQQSFRAGYIQAANEVSRCLATFPKVDIGLGTKLMTHLGLRLNQLESTTNSNDNKIIAPHTPLRINCNSSSSSSSVQSVPTAYSPVSSGYASDSDYSRCSPAPSQSSMKSGLLQVSSTPMWRPW